MSKIQRIKFVCYLIRGEAVPAHYELKAVTKDGQKRWFDLAAASINYGGQTATLAMAYDITKQSKTSKEIALMLNVSPKAVSFHRGNIRKKLGLVNKKINLRTYLQSFPKQNS